MFGFPVKVSWPSALQQSYCVRIHLQKPPLPFLRKRTHLGEPSSSLCAYVLCGWPLHVVTSILVLRQEVEIQNGGTQSNQLSRTKAIFWSNNNADERKKYCFAFKCERLVNLEVLALYFSCPLRQMAHSNRYLVLRKTLPKQCEYDIALEFDSY